MNKTTLFALLLAALMALSACQQADRPAAVTTGALTDAQITHSQTEALTIPPETDEPAEPETTAAPETTVPETTIPETTVPETTIPETTVPETTVPVTTPAPETKPPETKPPETKPPETKPPETQPPETKPVQEKSQKPKILTVTYSQQSYLLIIGTAEPGTTLICEGGAQTVEQLCDDGIFRLTVIPSSTDREMTLVGRQEGKADSEAQVIAYQKIPRRNTDVISGSDNRLHYTATLADFQHHNVYNEGQMAAARARLEGIYESIQAISPGTKLICFIAPNHNTVYPESMPARYAKNVTGPSRLSAFVEYMADSPVIFISPDQYLIERKDQGYSLYQDTDTHWNELGAWYGVEYLLSYIAPDFPDVTKQLSLDDCDVFTRAVAGGDLLNMLGVNLNTHQEMSVFVRPRTLTSDLNYDKPYRMNFENIWTSDARVSTKTTGGDLPTGLMYRDSFSTNMMIFLSECFSRMDYASFGAGISFATIRDLQPDYVIVERVERNMDGIG